jgi:pimeloyl-ACP methyl ester carboxylesterase
MYSWFMKIMISLIFLIIGIMQMGISQDIYLDKTDISLHYRKQGAGEPLILLHGWLQTGEFWKPYMDEFGREHEVYAIDLRGHGKTSVLTNDFSIPKVAEDIVSFIRQSKLEKVKAIGLSYGGLVLLEVMAAHPDLIDRAVLIGVSNRFDGQEAVAGKPPFGYEDLDTDFREKLIREHDFGEQQVRALFNPETNYKIDIGDKELSRIKTRLLVINSDRDEIVGIDGAIEIYKKVPESSLWILPGTGHQVLNADNRQEFISRALTFLKVP